MFDVAEIEIILLFLLQLFYVLTNTFIHLLYNISHVVKPYEYDNIREVISNLSRIYENPTKATHMDLLKTGILYLDKLLYLEDEVKLGVPKAERLIRKLHREGAYDQLENVPFSILIGTYGWNSMEVAEYENIVHRAKEIWKFFLDEVNYGSFDENGPDPTPLVDSNYVYE